MKSKFSILLAILLIPPAASAATFPDVPATYAHSHAIERLTEMSVVSGNPDGTFRPRDPVNRAAMLAMLYRAAKKTPEKTGGCFPDVQVGSWYESTVCDAAKNGFVQGYAGIDGAKVFKPGQPVTRAEAIKLALAVLGIPDSDLSAQVDMYGDVAAADWYARYVHTALANAILPIPGQEQPNFSPGVILERGEAAAYVWNALETIRTLPPAVSSSSAAAAAPESVAAAPESAAASSSALTEIERRAAAALRTIEQEAAALKRIQENTRSVNMPFSDRGTFDGKLPFSYLFRAADPIMIEVVATITDWKMGAVTCRLYHLGRSGFSQEYYLGFEDGKNCTIRAALSPGNWRVELTPSMLSAPFSVNVRQITGDGNDGFSQANVLPMGQVRTNELGAGDLEDWFTFTVPRNPEITERGGLEMNLSVTGVTRPGCIIYPMDDVDVYGFRGPECEHKYLYPPGTYMVSIRHAQPISVRQTYTIQIK